MRLERRLTVLERAAPRRWTPASRLFAARVAALEGVDVEELVRDTDALLDRAAAAGMLGSVEDLCAFSAAAAGLPAADVLSETRAGLAAWKANVA